jgi:hypothetical protein
LISEKSGSEMRSSFYIKLGHAYYDKTEIYTHITTKGNAKKYLGDKKTESVDSARSARNTVYRVKRKTVIERSTEKRGAKQNRINNYIEVHT